MAFRNSEPSMNWNAKDTSEIALNRIFVEHVEKEQKWQHPKTQFTANPFSSIPMNNGLGMRGARRPIALPSLRAGVVAYLYLHMRDGVPPITAALHRHTLAPVRRVRTVPFVTDKVGFAVGQHEVEVGDDPDVQAVVKGLLDASKCPVRATHCK
jgi:hypothetical protein